VARPALDALDPQQAGVREVLVCENELSFAIVPLTAGRLVVWGAGSGVGDLLSSAGWLHRLPVRYWGDIDTHGFVFDRQVSGREQARLRSVRKALAKPLRCQQDVSNPLTLGGTSQH
jgi:hypothetical protein